MIHSLQDRLEVLAKKTTFTGSERPQVSDLVTEHMLRVTRHAHDLLVKFGRPSNNTLTEKEVREVGLVLVDVVNSALLTMHFLEISPPDNEELNEFLETLADEIQQDKILSSMLLTRSAAEATLTYYSDGCVVSYELEDALCDIICGAVFIAELIGYEASDLITGSI